MAHVAWRVARIAVAYPVHFYAAVLDNLGLGVAGGMYPMLVYIVEAQRHLVEVVGPHINGPWLSTPHGHQVHCGLRILHGVLGDTTLERIHAAAQEQPFASVADLCHRVALTPNELEHLIAAGAVDTLALSRRHARWEAQYARGRSHTQRSLLDEHSWPEPDAIEAETAWERAAEEYATLGWTMSVRHPLDLYVVDREPIVAAEQLAAHVGHIVTIAGVVVAGRRVTTATGRTMAFSSVCDRTGVVELTLFEQAASRYRACTSQGTVVQVTGAVTQDVERGISIEVHTVLDLQQAFEVDSIDTEVD